jgi:hypothetical protein
MKKLDLTTIPNSGLATLLSMYETKLKEAHKQEEAASSSIDALFEEAENRDISLYKMYENERQF